MAAALYDPEGGYYATHTGQIGRGGDFFTSVSVGEAFGQILAERAFRWWQEAGQPEKWRIVELGSHNGDLCRDLTTALAARHPEAFSGLRYTICEPLPRQREALRLSLGTDLGQSLELLSSPDETPIALPGLLIANEVLDAIPCDLIELGTDGWVETRVTVSGEEFAWTESPLTPERLPDALRGGLHAVDYSTELRDSWEPFLKPLLALLSAGRMIWIDYGFAAPEYYDAHRHAGTLRTFSHHRAGDDPLSHPGEVDITAHVEFTGFAQTALNLGLIPVVFDSQGNWLTRHATEWLHGLAHLAPHERVKAVRQFQTLTHPSQLGSRFHVIELSWKEGACMDAITRHRLALPDAATD